MSEDLPLCVDGEVALLQARPWPGGTIVQWNVPRPNTSKVAYGWAGHCRAPEGAVAPLAENHPRLSSQVTLSPSSPFGGHFLTFLTRVASSRARKSTRSNATKKKASCARAVRERRRKPPGHRTTLGVRAHVQQSHALFSTHLSDAPSSRGPYGRQPCTSSALRAPT